MLNKFAGGGKCISYSCIQVFGFSAQAERAKFQQLQSLHSCVKMALSRPCQKSGYQKLSQGFQHRGLWLKISSHRPNTIIRAQITISEKYNNQTF